MTHTRSQTKPESPERDDRLNELIASYLDREAAGQAPERAAWLAEHSEFAAELSQFLDEHERLGRVGAPLRILAGGAGLLTVAEAGADQNTRVLDVVRYFGDYELLEEIARGGMGVVYKARQKSLNRLVALKMILAGQLATPTDVQRFRTEAEAAAGLDHPNIVPIYEVNSHEGQHYFSMKLIEGENLAQAIAADRWQRGTRTGQLVSARLVAVTARAVHYAHQRGIIHRDLKPANVLVSVVSGQSAVASVRDKRTTDNSQLTNPQITDFGLAKRVGGDSSLTNTGAIVGTPSYMSPEQAAGSKQLTVASDVYSLGAILYEMLTGQPPFRAATSLEVLRLVGDCDPQPLRRTNSSISRDLETICLKCLEKEPERRYRSAEALADDLERYLAGDPIEARPSTAWERGVKWARRRPAVAALVGVSFVSIAALLVGGLVFNAELQVALQKVSNQQQDINIAQQSIGKQQEDAKNANTRAQDLMARADSLRLVAQSEIVRTTEPALAMLLGLEAAKLGPRQAEQNNALAKSLTECREVGPLLNCDGDDVRMVRWFADGQKALTISSRTVRIWDIMTGRKLVEFDGPKLRITSYALSPNEKLLALTFAEHFEYNVIEVAGREVRKGFLVTELAARVYSTDTGVEVQVLRGHADRVNSVAFSLDSKQIVTSSTDCTARIWKVETGGQLQELRGHTCEIASAVFTKDGRVLTVSSGVKPNSFDNEALRRTIKKWPAGSVDPAILGPFNVRAGGMAGGHGGGLIQGEDLFACLWNAETGAKITEFKTSKRHEDNFPRHARLDPNGKFLVAANFTGATVWDAQSGKELRTLPFKDEPRQPPVFSPDGKRVLVLFPHAVRIWSVEGGSPSATIRREIDEFRFARFSPDATGQHVVTTSEDKTAQIWLTATGTELFSLRGHEQGIGAADYSPDGRRVVTGSDDGTARIWNVDEYQDYERMIDTEMRYWSQFRRARLPVDQKYRKRAAWSAAVSPNGERIAIGSYDGTLRLWETISGKLASERRGYDNLKDTKMQNALTGEIFSLAYSRDGKQVLTVSADFVGKISDSNSAHDKKESVRLPYEPVRIYKAVTGEQIAAISGHRDGVRYAHFSPDGTRVLTVADNSRNILIVDKTGRMLGSGTGGSNDRTARIFDAKTGRQLHVFDGDWKQLYTACWDPDGKRVCTVHEDFVIRIWDADSGNELQKLVDDYNNVTCAMFSHDGQRLLTWYDSRIRTSGKGGHTGVARVWDLASGKTLFSMQGSHRQASTAAYSPDGKWIVTAGHLMNSRSSGGETGLHGRNRDTVFADRTARIWNAETGALHWILYGHARSVHHAAFSRDSRWLVTASEDRTARVWDLTAGKEFITLRGHDDDVKSAEFTPDARSVLTISWDGTARLWPVDPLPIALARKPRELTDEERDRFEIKKSP